MSDVLLFLGGVIAAATIVAVLSTRLIPKAVADIESIPDGAFTAAGLEKDVVLAKVNPGPTTVSLPGLIAVIKWHTTIKPKVSKTSR